MSSNSGRSTGSSSDSNESRSNSVLNTNFIHHSNIFDYLDRSSFGVHGVMFTNRDLIQSLMYISPFCYSVVQNKYNPGNVNSFMITINIDDEVIVCSAGRQTRSRSVDDHTNTVLEHRECNSLTFFLSTGFIFDHFDFKKPKLENDGKYIFDQTGDLIVQRFDLEELMHLDT